MNYANSIYNNNKHNKDHKYKKINNLSDIKLLLNNGYTIIKKNKETNKIEIIESNTTKEKRNNLEKKKYNMQMKKMIENWNNFRDNDIALRGDLSIYYNYKNEIEKIIAEDEEIEEMIKERLNNENKDNDYSSDEENNKYLLY